MDTCVIFECTACGAVYSAGELHTVCPACGKVLYPRYDLERAKAEVSRETIAGRAPTMWRYRELMPVNDPANIVTLGEGMTPLLPLPRAAKALGLRDVLVKDEGLNPTGSFKARGLSAAVSKAKSWAPARPRSRPPETRRRPLRRIARARAWIAIS